jgi:aspartyl/asparaginyl-tRNA synthetase
MYKNYKAPRDTKKYSEAVNKLRTFFLGKGFTEVHTQDRLSILAACEDPTTVATYDYEGQVWPLPQTGQMWLEYELLAQPELEGVFCVSTSYRNEPHPVAGRHERIFPMFEFEAKGTIEDLAKLETELCEYLGLGEGKSFPNKDYVETALSYGTEELSDEYEKKMQKDFGRVVLLRQFPEYTSPFWNMKRDGERANKIDVIIDGMETIGSAERSCDPEDMRKRFHSISGGEYAGLLYHTFGKERVEHELEDFLAMDFFPRYGGGIGMTRLMRAL